MIIKRHDKCFLLFTKRGDENPHLLEIHSSLRIDDTFVTYKDSHWTSSSRHIHAHIQMRGWVPFTFPVCDQQFFFIPFDIMFINSFSIENAGKNFPGYKQFHNPTTCRIKSLLYACYFSSAQTGEIGYSASHIGWLAAWLPFSQS